MANKLDRDSVEKIASAIVYRAVQDYIGALLTRDTRMIEDCESFFLGKRSTDIGDRFDILTNNLDGPSLVSMAKKKASNFRKECERHQPQSLDDYEDRAKRKACNFKCPFCGGEVKWVKRTGHINRLQHLNYVIVHKCEYCGIECRTLLSKKMRESGALCPSCKNFSFEGKMHCSVFSECNSFCKTKCGNWEARENE